MKKFWSAGSFPVLVAMAFLFYFLFQGGKVLLEQSSQAVKFKYTLDYGEGPLLDQSFRLSQGENIYHPDVSTPPYTIANYPPLFVMLQVPFVWAVGPALWYGRMLSLISTLLAGLFTGLTTWVLTRDRAASLVAGFLLLMFPYVMYWTQLNRIDNLALFFLTAGLYFLTRNPNSSGGRILSALLLSAAVFTRQSYLLAGPLAALVFLVFEPSRPAGHQFERRYGLKRAAHFAAWFGGTCLALFLLLMIWSRGGFFFHIVTANVNPFYWETVKNYARDILRYMPFLLAGALGMLIWGLSEPARLIVRLRRKIDPARHPVSTPKEKPVQGIKRSGWWLSAPFLLGAMASAVTIGKDGSNVNYLLEFCAALSLATGVLIAWAGQESRAFKIALIVVLALQVNIILHWSGETYATYNPGRYKDLPQLFQLNMAIQRAKAGPILADEHMAMLAINNRSLVYQPFEFKMLSQAGKWDQTAFLESIRRKEFPLILLYDPEEWDSQGARWTPEQLDAIYANYRSTGRLANTILLVPQE